MEYFHNTIQGWCSNEQAQLYGEMVDCARTDRLQHFVEVGAWRGQSTAVMGVMIENSGKHNIKFDVVDTWKGSAEHARVDSVVNDTLYDEFIRNMKPIAHRITPIRALSVDAAKKYKDASLDFVFIDAGHSYEDVDADIKAWLPKLKPGGVLAGDDYDHVEFAGLVKAVEKHIGNRKNVSITGRVWKYIVPLNPDIMEDKVIKINKKFDKHLQLNNNFEREIGATYIIALEGNAKSKIGVDRCKKSCERVGQGKVEVFYGYDGTDKETIKTPDHLKKADYMKWIKLLDPALSITEVACALSHIAVWAECMRLDKPIVILEHDAVMFHPYKTFKFFNAIEYLGHSLEIADAKKHLNFKSDNEILEMIIQNKMAPRPALRLPIPNIVNQNYMFPMGFHAYAIDPMMARRLFSKILLDGLINPVDTVAEMGEFEVIQTEVYACDGESAAELSTININGDPTGPKNMFNGRKYTYDIPGVSE